MSVLLSLLTISAMWGYGDAKTLSYGVMSKFNVIFDIDFDEDVTKKQDIVNVQVYYEVHCPPCIKFDSTKLKKVLLLLGSDVDIKTYPYGNANTTIDDQGKIIIQCQHGEAECYGNRLHACALNILSNHTKALLYNMCMMEDESGGRSDDKAAEKCGELLSINAEPIKKCAKSQKGMELLKYYGEETQKIVKPQVPWIFVNGKVVDRDINFFSYVCRQFKNPPIACFDSE